MTRQGLTLVELLVGLVLLGLLAALTTMAFPNMNRTGSNAARGTAAALTVEQVTGALADDFAAQGTFREFLVADQTTFSGIFTTGAGVPVQAQSDFAQQTSLRAAGLPVQVGDLLYLVGASGERKLLRVTGRSGNQIEHDGCRNGVSGLNAVVYRASTLTVRQTGGQVWRSVNGAPEVLAAANTP
ncbi:prepilin-type N-terminal cleavage/methylation domain-containing protein [Deinococcus multiflagellatus]|uniref:Prepilin-type N-terminal cleavage/methylation domain-containing protein n=1 Tax=Deinococcus multiflagellatus TaxID=1656887 RepID=A0ABW1ZT12_9DEIO